jgi:hypothetical protein
MTYVRSNSEKHVNKCFKIHLHLQWFTNYTHIYGVILTLQNMCGKFLDFSAPPWFRRLFASPLPHIMEAGFISKKNPCVGFLVHNVLLQQVFLLLIRLYPVTIITLITLSPAPHNLTVDSVVN